jgi:hypothetical protein
MIHHYNQRQQILILNSCEIASELLEIKDLLGELQIIDPVVHLVYDRMMYRLLTNNKICSNESKNQ